MKLIKSICFLVVLALTSLILIGCEPEAKTEKTVIYLYPTEEQTIEVKLDYKGEFTCTYPEYKDGWKVIAEQDGTLINYGDNKEYSYLYWEGNSKINWDLSSGFVVKGEDTREFLQEKLEYLGLTPREYNEFIVYWLPILEENKYNLIHFAGGEYDEYAKLQIKPKPDSILRVMMVYKPLEKPIDIEEQQLHCFERKGFTVIEWGGTKVN